MIFRGIGGILTTAKSGVLVQSPVSINIYTPRKELVIYTRPVPQLPPRSDMFGKWTRKTERHISRKTWEDVGLFTELVTKAK